MAKRNRIYSLRKGSVQWNEEDRLSLCGMLIKAGYAARIGRGMIPGTEGRKTALGQVTNLIMPKFIARKPKIKHGTYNKYGFAITLHQYCICPRCNHILNAGPDYQPDYCSKCGQHVNCSDVPWEEEVQLGYVRKEERCE